MNKLEKKYKTLLKFQKLMVKLIKKKHWKRKDFEIAFKRLSPEFLDHYDVLMQMYDDIIQNQKN